MSVCLVDYPDLIRQELGVPENLKIVLGICLGHPVQGHPLNMFRSERRPLEEAVRFR